jgi:uncharacterized protein (DUF2062 family)
MNKKTILNKSIRFLKSLYLRIFRIHDSPQRVAIGFGLGAFMGILPGTGPLAALLFAALFRVNKAAAFLGGLLTNTWLSLLTIALSIKVGASIMGLDSAEVYNTWKTVLKDFHWKQVLESRVLSLILPVLTGYLIVALCLGVIAYIGALVFLTIQRRRHENKNRTDIPR